MLSRLEANRMDNVAGMEQGTKVIFGEVIDAHHIVKYQVMRGPVSLCAYVGVPMDHSLAYQKYQDIDLDCHGGLTFSQVGDGIKWEAGYWWLGWDYAHFGDRTYPLYQPEPGIKEGTAKEV